MNQSRGSYNHLCDDGDGVGDDKLCVENDINAMSMNIDIKNLETIDFNVESQYESKFM